MFYRDDGIAQKGFSLDLRQETPPISPSQRLTGGTSPRGEEIAFTNYYMTVNGQPCIPVMGEFHFSRFPRQYWQQELQKMRAGGIQIVATYIFWIHVEEEEGIFDWSGDRDVRSFLAECQAAGLWVLLRVGPFAHGECRNGGLPDWLYAQPFPVRSNDERYLAYVRRYYNAIGAQVADCLFKDGGPVIGIQLDNEYMHCGAPWEVTYRPGTEWVPAGSDGAEHMLRLKQLAQEAGLEVPFYSCTAWLGSPVPERDFLPMQGGYAFTPWIPDPDYQQGPTREFLFRDRSRQPLPEGAVTYDPAQYPYACCELGGGIQITYHHRPIVPPECVQAQAVVALGSGANLLGYYMYHGGSNPIGKHAYLNEFSVPRISYDFQAPIREYGQLHESYHRLRALHLFLHDFGSVLAPMAVALPEGVEQIMPEDTSTLRYAARHRDGSGFLFLNNYQDHVELHDQRGVRIHLELPSESLSLPRGPEGLVLRQGISAIFPFNLRLAGDILLKYATAQLLTKLQETEQTTYVFFSPDGLAAELALDHTTYQNITVTGGTLHAENGQGYITAEPGLSFCVHATALDGTCIQILLLTQQQAFSAWKMHLWGEERLVLSDALVFNQEDELHCYWQDRETMALAFYPQLQDKAILSTGTFIEKERSIFAHYLLKMPEQHFEPRVQQLDAHTISISLPAMLPEHFHDVFLRIDYLGDTGHAYLDGRLVSDHFANGLPWEIGLKRFLLPDKQRELLVRFSPLHRDPKVLSYFPTGMAFRPSADGVIPIELRSVTSSLEYHAIVRLLR